ncbi:hypothetical protein JTE90_007848 [Oedothorax gibbosus]|uniref:Uncharacterized protein n=1 Tax=Oedothorax gibbosus TaxID=931172 RepID=A0AAV6VJM3_9ARAC|nr:hypothetical protein JTE90_007848 [Oedothorax gibbosus]
MKILLVLTYAVCISATILPYFLNHLIQMKLKFLKGGKLGDIIGGNNKNNETNGDNGEIEYANVCIYSSDPGRFKPKCFLCPEVVYPGALAACANEDGETVDFDQASCVENNCEVEIPNKNAPIRTGRDTSKLPKTTSKLPKLHRNVTIGLYSGPIKMSDIRKVQRSDRVRHLDDNNSVDDLYNGNVGGVFTINGTDYLISRQVILIAGK